MATEKWNDQAIDQLAEQLRRLAVDGSAKAIRAVTQVEAFERDLGEIRDWIREVDQRAEQRIADVRDDLRDDIEAIAQSQVGRQRNRMVIVGVLIAGCFTVLAALIAALATIVTAT